MTAQDEWGPWIEHDGNGCPCVGEYAHTVKINGNEWFGIAGVNAIAIFGSANVPGSAWVHKRAIGYDNNWVIRYRIRKPRGMAILESIMTDLPMPTKRVDA